MSQKSSPAQDPTWVSIPFAKFSHNSSPYGTRNFTWNHVSLRNDLDFVVSSKRVLDENGNYESRKIMKITAGADILEYQDLGELVNFVRTFDPSSGAEHPVQVVIKCPFMAMRYPKTTNTVRRIQLKFHNELYFTRALDIMMELGLPITETGSNKSTARTDASPAYSIIPSIPEARLSTVRHSAPQPGSSAHNSAFSLGTPFGRKSSCTTNSDFKVLMRPDTSSSDTQRPTSAFSCGTSRTTRPLSTLTAMSEVTPASTFSAISSTHEYINRSPLYVPPMEKANVPSQPVLDAPRSNMGQSISIQGPRFQSHGEGVSGRAEATVRIATSVSSLSQQDEAPQRGLVQTGPPPDFNQLYQDRHQAGAGSTHHGRPPSTVVDPSDIHDIWIPPRRELPFPKPRTDGIGRSSSVSDLPPLPTPTLVKRMSTMHAAKLSEETSTAATAPKPAKKRIAPRKKTVAQSQERTLPTEACQTQNAPNKTVMNRSPYEDEPFPLATKDTTPSRTLTALEGLQSKTAASKKRVATSGPARPSSRSKRPKMIDQGTQTQTLSGRDHTTAIQTTPNNDTSGIVGADQRPAEPQAEIFLNNLDAIFTAFKAQNPPNEVWETPGYADTNEEQREVILNDFICENLENRDFLKLCEDAEKAWRRVGLGM